jgi:AcrR family transcriptional regulator
MRQYNDGPFPSMAAASASPSKTDVVEKFRVDTITAAAMRAIAKKGVAVTVQDVADEAGIAKGTVYLYFKDRDELLQHVNGCAIADLVTRLDSLFERHRAGAPIDEILPAIAEAKLRFFDERRDFYRVHFELRFPEGPTQVARGKEKAPAHLAQKEEYFRRLASLFRSGGASEDAAPRLALMFFESAVAVILRRLRETAPPPVEKDARLVSDLFLFGALRRKDRSRAAPKTRTRVSR